MDSKAAPRALVTCECGGTVFLVGYNFYLVKNSIYPDTATIMAARCFACGKDQNGPLLPNYDTDLIMGTGKISEQPPPPPVKQSGFIVDQENGLKKPTYPCGHEKDNLGWCITCKYGENPHH